MQYPTYDVMIQSISFGGGKASPLPPLVDETLNYDVSLSKTCVYIPYGVHNEKLIYLFVQHNAAKSNVI